MAGDSKTEKATPKRRRDERKKGNVLMSKDAVAVATLVGSLFMIQTMGSVFVSRMHALLNLCFSYMASGSSVIPANILNDLLKTVIVTFVVIAGPFLAVTAILAIGVTFFQTKMLVAGESIKPKFSRLNPLQGLKRLFSLRSVIEALKGILKISILLILIYNYFSRVALSFSRFLDMSLSQSCSILFQDIMTLVIQIAVAFAALAFFDYLYQWWDYERQLKMSKQEIKEEYKQTEGDPQVKGKIRQKMRETSMKRMMQSLPQADVVITNPTHYAVAIKYDPQVADAPLVIAKGEDYLAARIKEVARENKIEIVENKPLARMLYANVDIGQAVPPELYQAVAEVLAFVYQLQGKI